MKANPQSIPLQGFQSVNASPNLSPFIDNYWCIKSSNYAPDTSHFLHSDCASGIIFNFRNPLTINDTLLNNDGYICTPFYQSQQLSLTSNVYAFGIRFKPGATKLFTNDYANGISNQISTVLHLLPTEFIYEKLDSYQCFNKQVQFLNRFFTTLIQEKWTRLNIQDQNISQSLLNMVTNSKGNLTLNDLSASTGLHTKKIERLFAQFIGINFRQCTQIIKAKQAINLLKTQPDLPLSELALSLHYFDQSHFTHQFKKVIGTTPSLYRKQKQKLNKQFFNATISKD